jgi:integrase
MTTEVEKRTYRSGTVGYRIRWRVPGESQQQCFSHLNQQVVRSMRAQIEALGHCIRDDDPRVTSLSLVNGHEPSSSLAVPTFGDACREYIRTRANASSRTRHRYTRYLELHLTSLERRRLDRIKADEITALVNDLRAVPLADSTINGIHGLIAGVYKRENARGTISVNPATERRDERGIKRRRKWEDKFLTQQEYDLLARFFPPEIATYCEVLIGTGMRWGEVAVLEVADLDLGDKPVIRVTKTLHIDEHNRMHVNPAKAGSERTLIIDADLARLLRKHVLGRQEHDLVFPAPRTGGFMLYGTWHAKWWMPAVKQAKLAGLRKPVTPHVLRHSHGAWYLDACGDLYKVMRRLGHHGIQMTANVYGHRLPDGDDADRSVLLALRARKQSRHLAVAK